MRTAHRLAIRGLPGWVADHVATVAHDALIAELNTWPKPGLVSHVDQGSHTDMDAVTFEASAFALKPFFAELTAAGSVGADMPTLRAIGVRAERAMLMATGGVNTHRGAIFGLGLLCAAAGAVWPDIWRPPALSEMVRLRWGPAILRGPVPLHSHGTDAMRRFGAGGARMQAAAGFRHALAVGLPALRFAQASRPSDIQAIRVHTFFALLAELEDTNLLHRGGVEGLAFARRSAVTFLESGGVVDTGWLSHAAGVHLDFIARRLSPGGSADLLAITLFLERLDGHQS